MADDVSPLEQARTGHEPRVPPVLGDALAGAAFVENGAAGAAEGEIRAEFPKSYGRAPLKLVEGEAAARAPLHVGVVLSGGQAPGGHNVASGLFDGLQTMSPGSRLTGFLGGPRGILTRDTRELTLETLAPYRNTGGFDLIRSGRDKIASDAQLAQCVASCRELQLDGLVVIGGDDSNTNAAVIAEHFLTEGVDTTVVGVPKTIDGDLKGQGIEISFGFDTATKLYSELIGNICRDAKSAAKYWHFIKLMGRSASHVTLECALKTRPNVALIGEEVRERGQTLAQLVEQVADVVRRRAEAGRAYGVCLVPEGLIEFLPDMRRLIDLLNAMLAERADELGSLDGRGRIARVRTELPPEAAAVFDSLPDDLQAQLLNDRDSHGNVQVSRIDTEALLMRKVASRLEETGFEGSFGVQSHFFGYEGRCSPPSDFDAAYTYALGRLAAALAAEGKSGYMCAVGNLAAPPERWTASAVPLTSMMQMERRKGRRAPVIAKALVELDGAPFGAFSAGRERWALEDCYRYPGPIQYFGPPQISAAISETLRLESGGS